jgi:hypothetical protein
VIGVKEGVWLIGWAEFFILTFDSLDVADNIDETSMDVDFFIDVAIVRPFLRLIFAVVR